VGDKPGAGASLRKAPRAVAMALLALAALPAGAAPLGGEALHRDLRHYADLGIHRTGCAGDRAGHSISTQDVDLSTQWDQRADQIQVANLFMVGSFLAVAGVGILQANIVFQPQRDERKHRDLPPVGKLAPVVTPLAGGGAFVGVTGATF